ncbi:MAG: hypothetical protein EZS28_046763, partial [Streblomastix strix]
MRAELWGASASLIQCEGLERSIISGLRVSGCKSEFGICNGAAFEVTVGSLILIDIKVEKVIMIQNENERNSDINDKNKILGLIIMKENAKLLKLEKCIISNISIYNKGSIILMNGGLNSKLELGKGVILQDLFTYDGNAISVQPTGPSTIVAEGVIFKSLNQAVYVDMKTYDVSMQFVRCIFISNTATTSGSNVFIEYRQSSQRIRRESFLGCIAIASTSHEQEISVCYTIGDNVNEVFIDERDLLHSSWQRQVSDDIVFFIGNQNQYNVYDPNSKCNQPSNPCASFEQIAQYIQQNVSLKVETIQFCEGMFKSPLISVPSAQATSINLVGYGSSVTDILPLSNTENVLIQGQYGQSVIIEKLRLSLTTESPQSGFVNVQGSNAGLILSEVRVRGHLGTEPPSSTLEPKYLFHSTGIVYLEDVIIENIFLK